MSILLARTVYGRVYTLPTPPFAFHAALDSKSSVPGRVNVSVTCARAPGRNPAASIPHSSTCGAGYEKVNALCPAVPSTRSGAGTGWLAPQELNAPPRSHPLVTNVPPNVAKV